MRVVFRADASRVIGHGHVMRCLTLAQSLASLGADVRFCSRVIDGDLCEFIESQGIALTRLPRQVESDWSQDAAQTCAALQATHIDWLVVDHYAFDRRWERQLRTVAARIMVIDDLADRPHDCDLLLDQNLVAGMQQRYADKVPETCGRLFGPQFALLQPAYARLHREAKVRRGPIRRLFVFFSAADRDNLTGKAISAFLQLNREDVEVDVAVAAGSMHKAKLCEAVAGHANIHLHFGLPTLAPLLATADLALGAGGATSWERACVGLPTLVVTLADNQRAVAAALHEAGVIRLLGHCDAVDESSLANALAEALAQGCDESTSQRCLELVDGEGALRVSTVLRAGSHAQLRVRPVGLRDEALLLDWANDPVTRRNGFSSAPITPQTHAAWLHARLDDKVGCRFYVVETGGVAVGQVRFQRHDGYWEVHYAVAPVFRGRRIGRSMLETALHEFVRDQGCVQVLGKVKVDNVPSRRIFEALRFDAQAENGWLVFRKQWQSVPVQ